ncbi:MAG: Holliday junction resolvase RuvX [Planctomycetes bacterium]|nr:Holliday junction resolvase RuvX [Planctomycetota bacterium]
MKARILAIDYGFKRVGLAVTDPLGITAQPLPTYSRKTDEALIQHVQALVAEKEIGHIIVGLPLNMDGSFGPKAAEASRFADRLRPAVSAAVELWDERLTSWQAEQDLSEAGLSVRKEREKGRVDRMAAQILLQSYLARPEGGRRRAEGRAPDGPGGGPADPGSGTAGQPRSAR